MKAFPRLMPSARGLLAILTLGAAAHAAAEEVVRVGVATRAFWPTVVVRTAIDKKLFEKEGLKADMTIYRSGAEAFEALAAGAADLTLTPTGLLAVARQRGVAASIVANASDEYAGWVLAVKADSKVASVNDLANKNVGITSVGSGTDVLALWAQEKYKVKFNRVPVGGGGLVPNLQSGNVDAVVLFPPASYQMSKAGRIKLVTDFGKELPRHMTGGWAVTDAMIATKPKVVQGSLNALYGAVNFLQNNRDYAVKLIAENNEISTELAEIEFEQTIMSLSKDGSTTPEKVSAALDLARLSGAKDLAPANTIVKRFDIVATRP